MIKKIKIFKKYLILLFLQLFHCLTDFNHCDVISKEVYSYLQIRRKLYDIFVKLCSTFKTMHFHRHHHETFKGPLKLS